MHRALAALVVAVLAVPAAAGQAVTAVTEDDFLAAVAEDHPAIAALRGGIGEARAGAIAAATLDDPALALVREDPDGAAEQLDLTVSWRPPGPGRGPAVAAAEHAVAAAEARFAADRLALRLALREVYARWAVSTARAGHLAGHAERIAELARRERLRAERGEASGLEARRLELAAGEAAARLALAEAETAAARESVRAWAPALDDDAVPVLPPLPPAPEPAGEPPQIAALEEELAAARLARRSAARVVEAPELIAGWQRQELDAGSVEGPILGLSWPLPLLDRNRAARNLAASREAAAAARLEAERTRLAAERAGRLAAYRRLAVAARDARAAAAGGESMVAAAVAAFGYGEASLTDLLDVLRSTLEAETSALDLLTAALAAHRDLEAVSGRAPGPTESPTIQPTGDTP